MGTLSKKIPLHYTVGLVLAGLGLAQPVFLVLGALVSATDPVVVVARFRPCGAPKELTMLLDGENPFEENHYLFVSTDAGDFHSPRVSFNSKAPNHPCIATWKMFFKYTVSP